VISSQCGQACQTAGHSTQGQPHPCPPNPPPDSPTGARREEITTPATPGVRQTNTTTTPTTSSRPRRAHICPAAYTPQRHHGEVTTLAVAAYGTVYALIGSGMLDLARTKLDSLALPAITRGTAGVVGELMMGALPGRRIRPAPR
jgi:hypothetical protein